MRSFVFVICSAALLTTACAKKVAVAPPTPAPTPVAEVQQAPAPVQRAAATPAPVKTAPQEAPRPTRLNPQQRAQLNDLLARMEDALFDYDRANIRDDARQALSKNVEVIRNILADYPAEKLKIEGNADQRGSDEYNMALADRRAAAVEEFLANMGIPKQQLVTISYGKEKPVCTDSTEECWQKNRRAHITVQ